MVEVSKLNFNYHLFRETVRAQFSSPDKRGMYFRRGPKWLAAKVGVGAPRMRNILRGYSNDLLRETKPSLQLALRICRVLQLDIQEFMT